MEKHRNYGLDILRILAIVFITIIHFIGYSDILDHGNILNINYIILTFFSTASVAGVNVFVLITGFFQCEKEFDLKKIFDLWMQVFVLSVLLMTFSFMRIGNCTLGNIINSVLPLSTFHFWFLVTYVMLYIISPMINYIITQLGQKRHLLVCIVGAIVICIFFVMNPFANVEVYLGHYHGICWFVYLYIIGAYIKKYGVPIKNKYILLVGVLVFALIYIIKYFNLTFLADHLLNGNYSLLALLLSIIMFVLFKEVEIKNKFLIKSISKLSMCSFFVYIIQEHNMIRKWYWGLFNISEYADSYFLIILFIISIFALWPFAYMYSVLYYRLIKKHVMKIFLKLERLIVGCTNNSK